MIPKLVLDLHTGNKLVAMAQLDFFNHSAKKLVKNGYMFELCATDSTRDILKEYYNKKQEAKKHGHSQ